MQIIKPSATLMLPPSMSEEDQLTRLELIGRTAYKSESKITEGSSIDFVRKIIKSGHESVLEHMTHRMEINIMGRDEDACLWMEEILNHTVGMQFTYMPGRYYVSFNVRTIRDAVRRLPENPLVHEMYQMVFNSYPLIYKDIHDTNWLFYPNLDTLVSEEDLLTTIPLEEAKRHIYRTVKFICDRGVSHELVRHRICAITQESTRYCNYSKMGVTFIEPPWGFTGDDKFFLASIENKYNSKMESGQSPQQARYWLNTGLKTELNITMSLFQWHHFFSLRTPTTAHPQMREVTIPLLSQFKEQLPFDFATDIIPVPLATWN